MTSAQDNQQYMLLQERERDRDLRILVGGKVFEKEVEGENESDGNKSTGNQSCP